MSAAIIVLIIAIVLLLIGVGIGIYFAFFRKTQPTTQPPSSQPPSSQPPTTQPPSSQPPTQPPTTQPPSNGNGNGSLTPLNPVGCQSEVLQTLRQTSLQQRSDLSNTIFREMDCFTEAQLNFWLLSNSLVYSFITRNPRSNPTNLANNYNSIFQSQLGGNITDNSDELNLSLWAIRALPTNASQLEEFNAFWSQPIPPLLQPQGDKPASYPPANVN